MNDEMRVGIEHLVCECVDLRLMHQWIRGHRQEAMGGGCRRRRRRGIGIDTAIRGRIGRGEIRSTRQPAGIRPHGQARMALSRDNSPRFAGAPSGTASIAPAPSHPSAPAVASGHRSPSAASKESLSAGNRYPRSIA